MEQNNDFPQGMITKEGNVDFCKARISFKVDEFKQWLDKNAVNGWVNVDVLTSREGKTYAKLNSFKPEPQEANDGMPF